ncbi:MAG: hypothetical protein QOD26_2618, partial [Betaproteobacteria bacterium]|nr:hypothetical protein [Betaproteobacteria bacterium]
GNDIVQGLGGADVLDGGTGADQLWGGAGNDCYTVDNAGDVVMEAVTTTANYTWSMGGYYAYDGEGNPYWVPQEVQTYTGTSTLAPAAGMAPVYSGGTTYGYSNFDLGSWVNDGEGNTTWSPNVVSRHSSTTTVTPGDGLDTVNSSVSFTLPYGLENLILTGASAINATGNELNNYLRGNSGDNTLTGGAGIDALEGGAGNDTLSDASGSEAAFLAGASGSDTLSGSNGRQFLAGGTGNDTIHAADGSDIVAFNAGDGQDNVDSTGTAQDNVLSLGGGITYANLKFSKSGNDLVLAASASDSVTLKNWYAGSKSFGTLQVVIEASSDYNAGSSDATLNKKVERFDLTGLANRFDQERAANPSLTEWALSNALTTFHLGGSDTAALGGDLAYYLGKNGTLAGMGMDKTVDVLSASGFAQQTQTIHDWATLQTDVARLSQ